MNRDPFFQNLPLKTYHKENPTIETLKPYHHQTSVNEVKNSNMVP
jgi:hypothetical protein